MGTQHIACTTSPLRLRQLTGQTCSRILFARSIRPTRLFDSTRLGLPNHGFSRLGKVTRATNAVPRHLKILHLTDDSSNSSPSSRLCCPSAESLENARSWTLVLSLVDMEAHPFLSFDPFPSRTCARGTCRAVAPRSVAKSLHEDPLFQHSSGRIESRSQRNPGSWFCDLRC